jgi:hypothetical protein
MLHQDHDQNRQEQYTTGAVRVQAAVETPAFQFSVLTCAARGQLATKILYPDGKETPYSNVKYFYYKYCELDSLEDFAKLALTWLANESKRFIIRGQLKPEFDASKKQRRLLYPKDDDPATIECPPRRWIPIDVDGARVPAGLGAPDKLAEAAYHIRDQMLPGYFRGVRCVASATSSTGRKGPCTARLRLFFVLHEAVDNEVLRLWVTGLSEKFIAIDPAVMLAMQPIYTARPWFRGIDDPVPDWGRVRLLDGYEDVVVPELPRLSKMKKGAKFAPFAHVCSDMPDWMLEVAEADAGLGVVPIIPATEISSKAWSAIHQIFDLLDGSPKNGKGRHESLNRAAWWLARLYGEGELPEAEARDAYWKAAEGINNSDGKYDAELLQRHIDDAFADVSRR